MVGLQSPAQASWPLPQSPRPYLAPGESLGEAHYILLFGQEKVGDDSIAGTGMQAHDSYGSPASKNRRYFHYDVQKNVTYDLAYKATCCTERVTSHLRNRIPPRGGYRFGEHTYSDGTALWLGHSRFQPGAAPKVNEASPPTTGTRLDATTGPADAGTAVRADNDRLISIPVLPNVETKRSFLVSANVYAQSYPGARYGLRPQPYLDRGNLGLTGPGGIGARMVDLATVVDRWNMLQVRADVVTNGGARADSSDDTGRVTYRYFLNNVEVGPADTFDMMASSLRNGQGDVRFGPAFGLMRGWQGDAPEVLIDNIAVYELQNVPFRTSWLGETILPEDAAKFSQDVVGPNQRHVSQNVQALWVDPSPTPDGKTLIYTNAQSDEQGRATGVYSYEIVGGRGVIRPYSTLGGKQGGDGRGLGGLALTGDGEYIYASYPRPAAPAYDTCVVRYARSAITPDISVGPEPFDGIADLGGLCLPDIAPSGDPQGVANIPQSIRGLAVSSQFLFMSHRKDNKIYVYRKDKVTDPRKEITVQDPRGMAYNPHEKRLWAIVNGGAALQEYLVGDDGALTPNRQLTGMKPSAVFVGPQGHLYVANDAQAAQQIQVFDTTKPQPQELTAKTLGDKGGVVAFGGQYGPARFDGLKGIAVDNAGNYYVASNGIGASQFATPISLDVRRFNGATKALEGQVVNYIHTSIVAPDPSMPGVVYSPTHRYDLNLDARVPGTEWSPQTTSLMNNRYKCPNDALVNGVQGQAGAIAVRTMGQQKYLFVASQGASKNLGIHKFVDDKHIQLAVFFMENADGKVWPPNEPKKWPMSGDYMWSWRDRDGDCQFDDNPDPAKDEFAPPLSFNGRSNWSITEKDALPHHRAGDIWAGALVNNQWGLKRVRFTGTFENGSPVYDTVNIEGMPIPNPYAILEGVVYQSTTDTLYVLGRTVNDPGWRTGWRMSKYERFYERHLAKQAQVEAWSRAMPDDLAFCPYDPNKGCRLYSFTVAGDRVYVGNAAGITNLMFGRIRMYDTANGDFKGSLLPGPEVAHRSGWHDIQHAVTAMQLPDGRRYAFSEENGTGKVLLYKGY